jgi:predicted  nucleic acid-binding Zn-ribbon protein
MAPIAPNAPAIAPTPPVAPDAAPVPEPVPEPEDAVAPRAPRPPRSPRSYTYRHISHDGDDGDSFAIIHGNDNTVTMSGDHNQELAKVRQKYHGDFIWFERDGKSYVITDPTILAQSEDMFKMDPRLKQMQESLDAQQKVLNKRMAEMNTQAALAQLETPEYKASMARLEKQLAELNGDQMKKLTAEIAQHAKEYEKLANDAALAGTADRLEKLDKLREFQGDQMEKLGELQGQIGEIHGQIGELQGQLGEKRGEWGEKQGELGEKMGELGEQMGKIGEEQGRKAEEASRKMKSVFDQAIRDGKAKPVE